MSGTPAQASTHRENRRGRSSSRQASLTTCSCRARSATSASGAANSATSSSTFGSSTNAPWRRRSPSSWGSSCASSNPTGIQMDVVRMLPQSVAERHAVFPVRFEPGVGGGTLTVAFSDPSNLAAIDDVRFQTGKTIQLAVAAEGQIAAAIRRGYYGEEAPAVQAVEPSTLFGGMDGFLGGPEDEFASQPDSPPTPALSGHTESEELAELEPLDGVPSDSPDIPQTGAPNAHSLQLAEAPHPNPLAGFFKSAPPAAPLPGQVEVQAQVQVAPPPPPASGPSLQLDIDVEAPPPVAATAPESASLDPTLAGPDLRGIQSSGAGRGTGPPAAPEAVRLVSPAPPKPAVPAPLPLRITPAPDGGTITRDPCEARRARAARPQARRARTDRPHLGVDPGSRAKRAGHSDALAHLDAAGPFAGGPPATAAPIALTPSGAAPTSRGSTQALAALPPLRPRPCPSRASRQPPRASRRFSAPCPKQSHRRHRQLLHHPLHCPFRCCPPQRRHRTHPRHAGTDRRALGERFSLPARQANRRALARPHP